MARANFSMEIEFLLVHLHLNFSLVMSHVLGIKVALRSVYDLYTRHEKLGKGAFGLVFKVTHKSSKEIGAVKEVNTGDMKPHQKHLSPPLCLVLAH